MVAAEVIDLTGLSSSPVYPHDNGKMPDVGRATEQLKNPAIDKDRLVPLEDGELPRDLKPTMATPQKQRKRKKSQQDPISVKDERVVSTDKRRRQGAERDNTPPRDHPRSPDRAIRRRTLHEIPSDSLFFVDETPADIGGSYVSITPAGPSSAQKNGGLMLPPHVNVANETSEFQEPSLPPFSDEEEGEEDFIDYLDVDGDRSVCISLTESLALCRLIKKMKF